MKRLFIFVCTLGILLTASGCNAVSEAGSLANSAIPYTLKKEGGIVYMYFDENASHSASANDTQTQIAGHTPKFDSVAELKTAIETGRFSQEDLDYLRRRSKNSVLAIGNPDNLYDVTLPSGLSATGVHWNVNWYSVDTNWGRNEYEYAIMKVYLDRTAYTEAFEQFSNYKSATDVVVSERTTNDKNALELIYTNSLGKFKRLIYQLPTDSGDLYIRELYCLETYESDFHWTVSESVPFMVRVFCDEGAVQWYAHFTGFEERPTAQWLTTLGVKRITE